MCRGQTEIRDVLSKAERKAELQVLHCSSQEVRCMLCMKPALLTVQDAIPSFASIGFSGITSSAWCIAGSVQGCMPAHVDIIMVLTLH